MGTDTAISTADGDGDGDEGGDGDSDFDSDEILIGCRQYHHIFDIIITYLRVRLAFMFSSRSTTRWVALLIEFTIAPPSPFTVSSISSETFRCKKSSWRWHGDGDGDSERGIQMDLQPYLWQCQNT